MASRAHATETGSGSRAPAAARTSGRTRRPPAKMASPIGTLIRNTHRQLASTSRPPIGGPDVAATAATPAQMPTTRLCSRFGNAGRSRPSDAGTITAAPRACRARAVTSTGRLGDAAHSAEAAVKAATPPSRNRRRPKWSASRPAGTRKAANTIA